MTRALIDTVIRKEQDCYELFKDALKKTNQILCWNDLLTSEREMREKIANEKKESAEDRQINNEPC